MHKITFNIIDKTKQHFPIFKANEVPHANAKEEDTISTEDSFVNKLYVSVSTVVR
jgi:hypothetical protein